MICSLAMLMLFAGNDLLLVAALSINLYRDRFFAYNPYPGENQSWEDLWDIHGVITPA
jgi:hypothetical protein